MKTEHLNDFSYTLHKNEKVLLYWQNKQVMVLKGQKAAKFTAKIAHLNPDEIRMHIAKLTGNFKRGNERLSSNKTKLC